MAEVPGLSAWRKWHGNNSTHYGFLMSGIIPVLALSFEGVFSEAVSEMRRNIRPNRYRAAVPQSDTKPVCR